MKKIFKSAILIIFAMMLSFTFSKSAMAGGWSGGWSWDDVDDWADDWTDAFNDWKEDAGDLFGICKDEDEPITNIIAFSEAPNGEKVYGVEISSEDAEKISVNYAYIVNEPENIPLDLEQCYEEDSIIICEFEELEGTEEIGLLIYATKDGEKCNVGGKIDFSVEMESVDMDSDGVPDVEDNCPDDPNSNQSDYDNDGFGNVCDNCMDYKNPLQAKAELELCFDPDGDGIPAFKDICEGVYDQQTDPDKMSQACLKFAAGIVPGGSANSKSGCKMSIVPGGAASTAELIPILFGLALLLIRRRKNT